MSTAHDQHYDWDRHLRAWDDDTQPYADWLEQDLSQSDRDDDDQGSAWDPMFDRQDLQDQRNFCRHGIFTGNPHGADLMCGWCESGEEPPTQRQLDERAVAQAIGAYERLAQAIYIGFRSAPNGRTQWWASLRQTLVDSIDDFGRSTYVQRAWDQLAADGYV